MNAKDIRSIMRDQDDLFSEMKSEVPADFREIMFPEGFEYNWTEKAAATLATYRLYKYINKQK